MWQVFTKCGWDEACLDTLTVSYFTVLKKKQINEYVGEPGTCNLPVQVKERLSLFSI